MGGGASLLQPPVYYQIDTADSIGFVEADGMKITNVRFEKKTSMPVKRDQLLLLMRDVLAKGIHKESGKQTIFVTLHETGNHKLSEVARELIEAGESNPFFKFDLSAVVSSPKIIVNHYFIMSKKDKDEITNKVRLLLVGFGVKHANDSEIVFVDRMYMPHETPMNK